MSVCLVYLTNRKNPRIEWFFDSLWRECAGDASGLKVLVIDSHAKEPGRLEYILDRAKGRFDLEIETPKPCVWQGEYRLTKADYFAASNARNTGIVLAPEGSYLVFVDDVSFIVPGWLNQVRHAERHGYVVCGAYRKVLNLQIEDGQLIGFEDHPPGLDSRFGSKDEWEKPTSGIVTAPGDWLYGCSFGAPLEALLRVDGMDEACDGMGYEDIDLGYRLKRSGINLFYNRNMKTLESEEAHHEERPMIRVDKKIGDTDASHIILNRVKTEKRIVCLGNIHSMKKLREAWRDKKNAWPLQPIGVTRHWPDNEFLQDMGAST